jgi:hypothetical protein
MIDEKELLHILTLPIPKTLKRRPLLIRRTYRRQAPLNANKIAGNRSIQQHEILADSSRHALGGAQ